jgi:hypothetical protein
LTTVVNSVLTASWIFLSSDQKNKRFWDKNDKFSFVNLLQCISLHYCVFDIQFVIWNILQIVGFSSYLNLDVSRLLTQKGHSPRLKKLTSITTDGIIISLSPRHHFEIFMVVTMTWLPVTEYLCHK